MIRIAGVLLFCRSMWLKHFHYLTSLSFFFFTIIFIFVILTLLIYQLEVCLAIILKIFALLNSKTLLSLLACLTCWLAGWHIDLANLSNILRVRLFLSTTLLFPSVRHIFTSPRMYYDARICSLWMYGSFYH